MNDRSSMVSRLRALEQRTLALRQQAKAQRKDKEDANTLWMSSLDIIGQLLNVVESLAVDQPDSEKVHLSCPYCRSQVAVSYEALADGATRCPDCGEPVLLSNPT